MSGLPDIGMIQVQVGGSRLGWRTPKGDGDHHGGAGNL
jgi:hypothetical protein